MDFTTLQKEYDDYWQTHNEQAVIKNLSEIDNYISNGKYDTWLNSYENLLKPEYLLSNYAVQTNQLINSVSISYSNLMKWFSSYLKSLINEITDYQKKLAALKTVSLLDTLLNSPIGQAVKGIGNVFEGLGNAFSSFGWALIPIAAFVGYKYLLNKG